MTVAAPVSPAPNNLFQTTKAAAPAQSTGPADADDMQTASRQVSAKRDSDDRVVTNNALGTSSSTVLGALLNLKPGGASFSS